MGQLPLAFQGSNIDGVRIPLCTYVQVEPEAEDPDGKGTLVLDRELGCVSCRIEVEQQCTKVPKSECRHVEKRSLLSAAIKNTS